MNAGHRADLIAAQKLLGDANELIRRVQAAEQVWIDTEGQIAGVAKLGNAIDVVDNLDPAGDNVENALRWVGKALQ